MDWHRIFILTVALFTPMAVGGCTEYQPLPIPVYIDTHFSEDLERGAILDVLDEWNEWAGGRYAHGDAVFEFVGLYDDEFNEHDYEDGRHVIYRISEPMPDEQYLQSLYEDNGGVGAYSPLSDAFIVMYPIDEYLAVTEPELLRQIAEGEAEPYDVEQYLRDRHYGMLYDYTLHELGHMLGLMHYNNRPGVMNSAGPNIYRGVEHLTDADLDAFCLIYDCCCDCND